MATRVRSFCKINLGLAVGPLRADGLHGLTTMYQTLALHDVVTVSARVAEATRITLAANHAGVPRTETGDAQKNTAYAMVARALERMGICAEVEIDIEKNLPVQGGLGAGSANAAAALIGLERELARALPGPERLRLAAEVGSDVPLFLLGGTVLGLGRGEQVYPLPDLPRTWCVVAVPEVGVSTKLAFAELDKRSEGSGNSDQGSGSREQGTGFQGSGSQGKDAAGCRGNEGVNRDAATGDIAGPSTTLRFAQDDKSTSPDPCSLLPAPCSLLPAPCSLLPAPSPLTFAQGGDRLKQLSRVLASVWSPDGTQTGPSGIARSGSNDQMSDLAEKSGSSSNLFDGVLNPLLTLVRTGIENDFEEVAFSQHPSLRSTKRDLQGSGLAPDKGSAMFAYLSGSGSALFGLYANEADARAAQQRVLAGGTRAVLTETLTRKAYWDTMFAE